MRKFEIETADKFFSAEGLYNTVSGMKYVYDTAKEILRQGLEEANFYVPRDKEGKAYRIDDEVDAEHFNPETDMSLIGTWDLDDEVECVLNTINSMENDNLYEIDCEIVGFELGRHIMTIM